MTSPPQDNPFFEVSAGADEGLNDNGPSISKNLNDLWWDLVEKYQLVRRREGRQAPDYASRIHIVSALAYYHSYFMGQPFADRVLHAIARHALNGVDPAKASFVAIKGVGDFLKTRIFAQGRSFDSNGLTKQVTGD
jgi:peptidyl-dipeptidase A